ncbi:hypothetical protein BDW59DRAFT_160056 [Aspergillus cavernicola]|uniref:Nucleoside phosphorylase domain-containing protein n=1 Tax=Aspergillus cavernicola TaxID=176166 RepID=A0ABR4IJ00_9EURO
MGKGSAASAAASLRTRFPNINLTLVVGICGGVPFPTESTEVILGDVIISHKVVKFDFGRQYPDGFKRRGDDQETLDRSNTTVRSLLSGFQTRRARDQFQKMHMRYIEALEEENPIWRYPGVDQDRLFPASSQHVPNDSSVCIGEPIRRSRLETAAIPRPCLHFGALASGDTVMKSAHHRDELARQTQIIGFEMEGAGVCDSLSCLIIKSVCDYADSHKNKLWQDYAAASAAACTKALLDFLEPKYEFASFIFRKTLQPDTGNMAGGIISQPSYEWSHSTVASHICNLDQHVQSVDAALHRLESEIPDPIIRAALVSAGRDVIQDSNSRMKALEKNRPFKSKLCNTIFGTILFHTQVVERGVYVAGETTSQTVTRTTFIFHPACWLLRLGFRYGLKAMALNHHKTWQYTILPVPAVPDNSLIFEFCMDGNIDGVRALFARGQASVRDTNTKGWSPLHFAALGGQFEIAKLLILEGADKRAYAQETLWKGAHTPVATLACSHFHTATLDILSLFGECIEFCETDADGWHLLSALEMATENQAFVRQSAHAWFSFLLHRFRREGAIIINPELIGYALCSADRYQDLDSINMILDFDPQGRAYAHLMTDPAQRRLFLYYINNSFLVLQVLIDRGIHIHGAFDGETPTFRSLRFSMVFFDWCSMARLIYRDIDPLIRRETSDAHAPRLQGWCFDTLRNLFSLSPTDSLSIPSHPAVMDNKYTVYCLECGPNTCGYDINDEVFIVEPWWESMKLSVKNRECVCSMLHWVRDNREGTDIRHISCQYEGTGSHDGYETAEETFEESDNAQTSPYNPIRNVREGSPRGGFTPFGPLTEYYYGKYGGWREEYQPHEYYCFECLAERELWELEDDHKEYLDEAFTEDGPESEDYWEMDENIEPRDPESDHD